MSRERKPFKRKSGFRDATLFVIATEGEKCEQCYFEKLVSDEYYYNPKVHTEVLPSIDGKSSPRDVIKLLDKFKKEYKLKKDDELWLVIDRDKQSWSMTQIRQVAQLCQQKKYELSLSNPCFEIWILLHLTDLSIYSSEQLTNLLENQKVTKNRTALEVEIMKFNNSYNKSNPDLDRILPNVVDAIERAALLDKFPDNRWQNTLGSKVYQLVQKLIKI